MLAGLKRRPNVRLASIKTVLYNGSVDRHKARQSASSAAKLGSREPLKVRTRWSCSWRGFQIRCTERNEMPTALAMAGRSTGSSGVAGWCRSALPRALVCVGKSAFRRACKSCRATTLQPNFGGALLPSPSYRSADANVRRDPLRRFPGGRGENNARPFDILPRLVAVINNRLQPFPVGNADDHTY
jgi:hypothetical protein